MNAVLYMKKMRKRESELIWKDEPLTDAEKLEMILCSIQPYSKWWRWGYVKSLKRAIKLLKEDDKKKAEQKHEQEKRRMTNEKLMVDSTNSCIWNLDCSFNN